MKIIHSDMNLYAQSHKEEISLKEKKVELKIGNK